MRFTTTTTLLACLAAVATLANAGPADILLSKRNGVANSCDSFTGTTSTCCASQACAIMKCNCEQFASTCAGACAGDCLNDTCITACSNRCESQFSCSSQACTLENYLKFGIKSLQYC